MNAVTTPNASAIAAEKRPKSRTNPRRPIVSLQLSNRLCCQPPVGWVARRIQPAAMSVGSHAKQEDGGGDPRYPPLRPAAEQLREPERQTCAGQKAHDCPELARLTGIEVRRDPDEEPGHGHAGEREERPNDAACIPMAIRRPVDDLVIADDAIFVHVPVPVQQTHSCHPARLIVEHGVPGRSRSITPAYAARSRRRTSNAPESSSCRKAVTRSSRSRSKTCSTT